MKNSEGFLGQWLGQFSYGPEYGPEVSGEKVQFRLFINNCNNDGFTGRSIDLEGVGADYEVAEVKGFIKGHFISFTKQYPHFYTIDELGKAYTDNEKAHPLVCYEGYYDPKSKLLKGKWEMRIDIEPQGDGWLEHVSSGTWEARKDD